jgi:hypothetical protein
VRRAAVGAGLAFVALAGCGGPDGEADETGGAVPVDSALVRVLVDVHLADARAALADSARRPALAESLRAVALGAHGLGDADLRDRHADLARDPEAARATYDAVDRALMAERTALPAAPLR